MISSAVLSSATRMAATSAARRFSRVLILATLAAGSVTVGPAGSSAMAIRSDIG
jgi:hypothetical protein